MNKYIGNEMQLYYVKEARLSGGKADGMRVLFVKNAKGLQFTVSLDRCADISELSVKGDNYAFIGPCGYVAPAYYDNKGINFLKSFTAGFFTTCGLQNAGNPTIDDGEELPLHGTVSNIPCENYSYYIENDEIHIKATVRDASLFAKKLLLEREYICPINENVIYLKDTVKNIGFVDSPIQMLYHCNMGYPLLSEKSKLIIPSDKVVARNEHSETGFDKWNVCEAPQAGYTEMCFYHYFENTKPTISLYNEEIKKGIEITYDTNELPFFTQWKMMGQGEYVMGLEPGNCLPDGRDKMREMGKLEILKPDETKTNHIKFTFTE